MNKLDLDEIKNIARDIQYEKLPDVSGFDRISDFKKIASSIQYGDEEVLTEETFDDFDTVYEAFRSGIELEIRNFITNLLVNNIENFAWVFQSPTTEVFKDAWDHALNKFTLRDQASRDQFIERIRILFRNVFLEKLNIPDQQTALDLADAYAAVFDLAIHQNLDKMSPSDGQVVSVDANDQSAEKEQGNELTYR